MLKNINNITAAAIGIAAAGLTVLAAIKLSSPKPSQDATEEVADASQKEPWTPEASLNPAATPVITTPNETEEVVSVASDSEEKEKPNYQMDDTMKSVLWGLYGISFIVLIFAFLLPALFG